nr:hypothetical protein [uncultured Helicobacter sp.]
MKQYIILLDRCGDLLSYILKHTSWNIAVLVTEPQEQTQSLIATYPHRITHTLNYLNLLEVQHCTHLDYDLIKQMKFVQIDVETMLHRVMLNNPIAKDIYYQYLSFFTEIFQIHKIDFVLNAEMILATPHHLIPFGLAKLRNIPSYTLEELYGQVALFYYNTRENLAFDTFNKPSYPIKEQCFYPYNTHAQNTHKTLKDRVRTVFYKIGGAMLVEFVSCLVHMSFKRKFLNIEYSYFSKLYSLLKHKRMHRYYKKHSHIPDLKENFIYFNLHLEPEAAIIGRATLEAQLTLIKMTANALPQGWKLYVKEHPHQLLMNDSLTDYFLHNIAFFKNIEFYKHITLVPNTTLVSLEVSSKELIAHSKAIATFNGTVCLESVAFQKPVIMFDSNSSPYRFLSNTLHIFSYDNLRNAIDKIQQGFPYEIKEDEEFAKLDPYISNMASPYFYDNLLTTITKHINNISQKKML